MWSAVVGLVGATLRYLAPALLALLWGQQSLLYKLIKHVEATIRSIIHSSDAQRDSVLEWLGTSGPVRVDSLETVWQHGWLLCGAIDAIIPGACAGHPPSRLSLEHAQTIAENYLGVEPVFSRYELESSNPLSKRQEWKLVHYLDRVRLALVKLSPPVSKQISPCSSSENQISFDYMAKGSGLIAAQINQKAYFKIYPSEQQSLEPGEITVVIKGPNKAYGIAHGPPILGKAQAIRQKVLGVQENKRFTEKALPLTQGATYFRNYGRNDMTKTYYIPKQKQEIEIDLQHQQDHLKCEYVVKSEGKYEIKITSRESNIVNSPFTVTACNNIIAVLEKEIENLENGEEINIIDEESDRKAVLRIVDFVNEKMLLKENGTLEKISDDDAKVLIYNYRFIDDENEAVKGTVIGFNKTQHHNTTQSAKNHNVDKFRRIIMKVTKIVKVCKIFNSVLDDKMMHDNKQYTLSRTQKDIPDVVNSTLNETSKSLNEYGRADELAKIIPSFLKNLAYKHDDGDAYHNSCKNEYLRRSIEKIGILSETDEDENYQRQNNNNNKLFDNPFPEELSLIKTNNNLNNSQEAVTRVNTLSANPIHIFINEEVEAKCLNTSPFLDVNVQELERPKTPILKIITGNITDRNDCIYVNPRINVESDETHNEFENSPFIHEHNTIQADVEGLRVTDFIIGAPVSLPPLMKAPSPEPDNIHSILLPTIENDIKSPMLEQTDQFLATNSALVSSQNFDEIEKKNVTDSLLKEESPYDPTLILMGQKLNGSNIPNDTRYETEKDENRHIFEYSNRNAEVPNKELWDSAYVSIDDNNSTPDTNNNNTTTMCEMPKEKNYFLADNIRYEGGKMLSRSEMGPAELEIWQKCDELNNLTRNDDFKMEAKLHKIKRHIFKPIIEEHERSISVGKNEVCEWEQDDKHIRIDPVSVAFAELDEVFQEYCPESENNSLLSITDKEKFDSIEINHTIQSRGSVDPASIYLDVERQDIINLEGKISEVQQTATELDSASQALHTELQNQYVNRTKKEFGERKGTNLVLEKKKYWDEKIKQIEEMKAQQPKRKKASSKALKHDSLTKKKGKQIVKNFLNVGDFEKPVIKQSQILTQKKQNNKLSKQSPNSLSSEKLVDKWKKYWDDKLESEREETRNLKNSTNKSPLKKSLISTKISTHCAQEMKTEQHLVPLEIIPTKQEIAEEVFKAFETSPKRFFGTSRKQILNKIDAFLKTPCDDEQLKNDETSHESGIVSRRINLYHNIAKVEPLNTSEKHGPSSDDFIKIKRKSSESLGETNEKKGPPNEHNFTKSESVMINSDITTKQDIDNQISNAPADSKVSKQLSILRKSSVSKSEMDIFNKVNDKTQPNMLEAHKSCEELPKINVKNFISLYENVSKTSIAAKQSPEKSNISRGITSEYRPLKEREVRSISPEMMHTKEPSMGVPANKQVKEKPVNNRINPPRPHKVQKTATYNIADIDESELHTEIIDLSTEYEPNIERESPDKDVFVEYKNRFKLAKEYFQSLEELRQEPEKKTAKVNECELLLHKNSLEKKENEAPVKTKNKIKSNTFPSSQLASAWDEFDRTRNEGSTNLVKISEKFNVEDLFNDVMREGRFSRKGSFKGIPHKKAVLETFKSMENISDNRLSPYEIAVTQLREYARENRIKNVQTYLTEYPYLPRTDPNKYHSRLDLKASGLISRRELLHSGHRRNSVPDLRLNATFTADL